MVDGVFGVRAHGHQIVHYHSNTEKLIEVQQFGVSMPWIHTRAHESSDRTLERMAEWSRNINIITIEIIQWMVTNDHNTHSRVLLTMTERTNYWLWIDTFESEVCIDPYGMCSCRRRYTIEWILHNWTRASSILSSSSENMEFRNNQVTNSDPWMGVNQGYNCNDLTYEIVNKIVT